MRKQTKPGSKSGVNPSVRKKGEVDYLGLDKMTVRERIKIQRQFDNLLKNNPKSKPKKK